MAIESMTTKTTKPRAIDLYSGVGGWSLGLRLSGIEVIASYERWGPANETNFKNNCHQAQTVDIRRLALDDLPENIDIVVGSPPCTQFSFSNRGGGGDIADGLEDIKKFLTIVDYLKPRVWAMENVPRVAKIIEAELREGGVLTEFAHLGCSTHIVDMAEYGVPQRRRRCIAGNFDIALLESYREHCQQHTLGDVVRSLNEETVTDALYGVKISKNCLTDHVLEEPLSVEEARINRANKTTHTVYNAMPFPDPLDRTVRTITATCTRVSRESIVIEADPSGQTYRRLTLRERASLQGFPLTFQFYGANYSQKLRMIGNAVPPAFTYLMGHVLQNHRGTIVPLLSEVSTNLVSPAPSPAKTPPDRVGTRYPLDRTFRFAIPALQLKSGVRFELSNDHSGSTVLWKLAFYFGTSKEILSLDLNTKLLSLLDNEMSKDMRNAIHPILVDLRNYIANADIVNMQVVWAHQGPGGTRAFMVLDKLDELGALLIQALEPFENEAISLIDAALDNEFGQKTQNLPGIPKLHRNSALILSGLLIGSVINPLLADQRHISRQAC